MLYVAGAAMGSVYKLTHLSLHLYQLQQMLEKYFEHFMCLDTQRKFIWL